MVGERRGGRRCSGNTSGRQRRFLNVRDRGRVVTTLRRWIFVVERVFRALPGEGGGIVTMLGGRGRSGNTRGTDIVSAL